MTPPSSKDYFRTNYVDFVRDCALPVRLGCLDVSNRNYTDDRVGCELYGYYIFLDPAVMANGHFCRATSRALGTWYAELLPFQPHAIDRHEGKISTVVALVDKGAMLQ